MKGEREPMFAFSKGLQHKEWMKKIKRSSDVRTWNLFSKRGRKKLENDLSLRKSFLYSLTMLLLLSTGRSLLRKSSVVSQSLR